MTTSPLISEIRLGLRAAWDGLMGRQAAVEAVPNDWGLAGRSFLAALIMTPWFAFERWLVYQKVSWYVPSNIGQLVTFEFIYLLQGWAVFPLAELVLVHLFGGKNNFPRYLTLSNWAGVFLLPLLMVTRIVDAAVPDAGINPVIGGLIVAVWAVVAAGLLFVYLRLARLGLGVSWLKAAAICLLAGGVTYYADTKLFEMFGLPEESPGSFLPYEQ